MFKLKVFYIIFKKLHSIITIPKIMNKNAKFFIAQNENQKINLSNK